MGISQWHHGCIFFSVCVWRWTIDSPTLQGLGWHCWATIGVWLDALRREEELLLVLWTCHLAFSSLPPPDPIKTPRGPHSHSGSHTLNILSAIAFPHMKLTSSQINHPLGFDAHVDAGTASFLYTNEIVIHSRAVDLAFVASCHLLRSQSCTATQPSAWNHRLPECQRSDH